MFKDLPILYSFRDGLTNIRVDTKTMTPVYYNIGKDEFMSRDNAFASFNILKQIDLAQ
jgi:hypothetical protein